MARTVTVGVDETRESMVAADWAAGEALTRGRPLRLVHVWSPATDAVTPVADRGSGRRGAERLLHAVAGHVHRRHPEVAVETAPFSGSPVDRLCDASEDAELLVLGSRRLGTVTGFVAGSVSQAVLVRVRRPVVLVRAEGRPARWAGDPAGDVVLGLGLDRPRDDVAAFAFDCAVRYGCGLRLVTDVAELEEREHVLDDVLAAWTRTYPAVPVAREHGPGRPGRTLAEASRGARLVVLGLRRRRLRWRAHLGPALHALLHDAAAPVAVVPHR
ncbi:universal stress protein [Streptomyces sp. NPDC006307]|uniref:universal stress protein n=1 Tax=Streptomyces sp. NPDC006307 TaxID=3156748 RepID=UPI0033A8DEC1